MCIKTLVSHPLQGISKALNMNFDGGDKPARLKSAAVISRVPDTVSKSTISIRYIVFIKC